MKRLFFIFLLFPLSVLAEDGCLTKHLKEAVELNQQRQSIYSDLSQGRSEKVSKILIFAEKFILFTLPLSGLENKAKELAEKGSAFLCEEFQNTPNPKLAEMQNEKPPLKDFSPIDLASAKENLLTFIEAEDLAGLHREALLQINALNSEMHFNCMTRHMLESMARIAKLGAKDPQRSAASLRLIKWQMWYLWGSMKLDDMAAPLQAQGLPILCHDLPVIDYL